MQCLGDGSSFDHQASVKRCFSEHRFPNGFPNEITPEITMISGAFYISVKRTFFEHTNSIVKNTGGDKMEYDAYQELANAIIVRAAEDYRTLLRLQRNYPNNSVVEQKIKELEYDIHTPFFQSLTALDVD